MGKVNTGERPEKENGSAFQQQKLSHFYAQNNPPSAIVCLFIVAVAFIPIGAAIIVASDSIYEKDVRYDQFNSYTYNSCNQQIVNYTTEFGTNVSYGCRTRVAFTIDEDVTGPVYMYYRIKNMYQNYRPYAKSMVDDQLQGGEQHDKSWLDDCNPYRTPGNLGPAASQSSSRQLWVNTSTSQKSFKYIEMTYSPCGAVPYSMFNDTLTLYKLANSSMTSAVSALGVHDNLTAVVSNTEVICDGGNFDVASKYTGPYSSNRCKKAGISFESDRETRHKKIYRAADIWSGFGYSSDSTTNTSDEFLNEGWYANEAGHKIPITTDEDFIVWAKIAGLADFRKLYRRLDGDLKAGTYVLDVVENFDVTSFGGEKHLVLATVGWVGQRNFVLGGLFVAFGGTSCVLAVAFLVIYFLRKKSEENNNNSQN